MHILALDSALGRCSAGVVSDGEVDAERQTEASGQATMLPAMVARVLEEATIAPDLLDLIAVTVGPGSFTGIRAALALAHGIALGTGAPIVGVTVGEALASALPKLGARRLWTAINARRERIFLERDGQAIACALDALPDPDGAIAVAGDAAVTVAARLAARDVDVMLTDARFPTPRHVAVVAARRMAGALPPRAALPLYIDPPEARLPQQGRRPPPVA